MADVTSNIITPPVNGVQTGTYFTAQAGGDEFTPQPGNRYILHFKNTNAAARTVKIDDPNSPTPVAATQFDPDVTSISIPATTGDVMMLIEANRFRHPTTGKISWTYAAAEAGVTGKIVQV